MDLCITLLSMGLNGYKRILETRHNLVPQFTAKFHDVAAKYGGRLLSCPKNTISFAITLDHLASKIASPELEKLHLSTEQADDHDSKMNRQEQEASSLSQKSQDMDTSESNAKTISYFGSMLFTRCVSGTRVIPRHEIKEVCGHRFRGYGSSTDGYPYSYLTAACAIGLTQLEMDDFFIRLDKCFQDYFATKKKVGL
jgi:O-phospho-L-seryl-tRNASec:L-selenocysteinyl-tRNA synthase